MDKHRMYDWSMTIQYLATMFSGLYVFKSTEVCGSENRKARTMAETTQKNTLKC